MKRSDTPQTTIIRINFPQTCSKWKNGECKYGEKCWFLRQCFSRKEDLLPDEPETLKRNIINKQNKETKELKSQLASLNSTQTEKSGKDRT